MRRTLLAGLLVSPIFTLSVSAGEEEVRQCAETLPDQAQLILQTLMPKLQPGVDVQSEMRSTVIGLVQSGKIDRATARDNAQSVAVCIRKLQDS